MKTIISVVLLIVFFVGAGYSQIQTSCFVSGGLKDEHRIRFTVSGRNVSGEFVVVREYDESRAEAFPFTGNSSQNSISVRFANGNIPDIFPKKGSRLTFSLTTVGTADILKLKLTDLKKDRGWFEVYSEEYETCEPSYGTLSKTAKRISFAKGAKSATVPVTLTFQRERKAFLINLKKGQRLSVTAIGCGISYFDLDKTPYDEGTAIDTLGIESIRQSGDHLFVISPAGVPGLCNVIFMTN